MVDTCAVNPRRRRPQRPFIWLLLGALGAATAPILVSCSQQPGETESVQQAAAGFTRVANTTLQMPSGGAATYTMNTAFAGLTFTAPIAVATPPGETNRLFVVERAGRIKVIPNLSAQTLTSSTYLDISSRVSTSGEEGLLGLAFHPNYATNGFFYVYYSTVSGTTHFQRVSRFKVSASANVADAASELIMIEQSDPATNHNGGDVHFGPDGYLYVSLGDGGQGNDTLNNAQHIDGGFFSGIIRIDVDKKAGNLTPNAHASVKAGTYLVPADNPFVGATSFNGTAVTASKVRTEFWAVGLRNPYRFSFDGATLWCGDVGQSAREEIDIIQKGKNYGWAFREGKIAGPKSAQQPAAAVLTDPIFDYPTGTTEGKAVIGGVVYRGTTLMELNGAYIYGDNTSGNVWSLVQSSPGVYTSTKLAQEAGVNSFGFDPRNGDILITNISSNTIRRLVRTSGGGTIPALLSQTGAFSSLATLTPNAGIVAYAPNVPFWSDNAIKSRWFSIPKTTDKMTFATDDNWTFPAGEVWIKHFEMEMVRGDPSSRRRLETRFLVKTANGAYGVTYKWNAAQTDADLVPDAGQDEVLTITDQGTPTTQTWRYPSRTECMTCHTAVGGLALSFTTRQLNGNFTYSGGTANQLQALSDAGYFTAALTSIPGVKVYPATDTTQSIETRARSYLQVNCAQCHQPGGTGQGNWDARMKTAIDQAGIINGALVDNRGDAANRVLVPQDPGHSMLLRRIQAAPNAPRMPPLASNVLDQASIDLINDWVMSVPATFAFEAEALTTTSTPAAVLQTDANGSGGKWMLFSPTAAGATIDYSGISLPAGAYTLKFKYKTNGNRGIISFKVDGTQVGGTLDEWASSGTYPPDVTVGNVTFASAGSHTVRLTVTGKNASSTGFTVSADRFTFVGAGPPPSPPAAPTGLMASGGVNQATLTWVDNANNETGFKIERKVQGAADSTYVVLSPTAAANATTFTDTPAAGSYTYRVKAFNGAGDSMASNTADATVTAPQPPAAPTGLMVSGGVNQAALSWVDNSTDETGFKIERKVQGAADSTYLLIFTTSADATGFVDSGVAAGSYTYRVKATKGGLDSAPSNAADATVAGPPPPAAPSNLAAMGGVGQASLTWTDNSSNETGFKVERKVQGAADSTYVALMPTTAANATSFTDNPAAGSYTYRVKATNGSGDSTPSNTADATVTSATASITNLSVKDNLPAGCVTPNCNKDKWSIQANIQLGAVVFGDRTYPLESVGNNVILGGAWIRTAADSKNYTGNPLATFTASGSSVYLVIDDRWNGTGTRPPFLTDATFVDQNFNVMVRESSTKLQTYSVYRKTITGSTAISLPPLGNTTAPAYFVIVK